MRHGNEEAGGQAASPTGRRLRILVVIIALAIAFALGGVVASRFMVTPAQRDAMADAPPASLLTATVTERELEDAVVTRGDVVALSAVDVLAGRRFAEDPAVITEAPLGTGKEAEAGAVLAEVNGRPVFALPGELPAFHDLAPGATGPLVVQLQDALKTMKLKVDDKPGEFGDSTAAAVGKLYTKAGFPAQETLPMAEVAFLPTLPAKVVSSTLRRGGLASEGSLVLAAGNLVVRVDNPDQQLIALAQKEAPTRLAHELIGEAVDAALQPMQGAAPVEGEASEVAASDDDGTSVTAVPAEPLPLSWLGANVRVTVASATTDGAVLTVPSTAIRVDGAGRAVVTVLADGTQSDVEVTTGLTGGGFVEVSGDIAAGAEVLVGIVRMSVPVIELEGVSRVYPGPPPVPALVDAHVRIHEGEYVTVVGPSGSGKSTFLNLVGLLDVPTAGTYLLNGVDTSQLGEDARTGLRGARIGFVFQSFHLMNHRSAAENVELALLYNRSDPAERGRRAAEALAQVRLGHRAHALPSQLSGGERQRVAIARALVHRPSVLLCDEPTGNLDSTTAREVLELIDDLHRDGLTVVVITHDQAVAARGQRTLRISDGRVSEEP